MIYSGNSPILRQGEATAAQIQQWLEDRGRRMAPEWAPDGKYHPPPASTGQDILELARAWGVNQDLVAGQVAKESAGLQSAITLAKNNPSGLGAENDDPMGKAIKFATLRDGIRATIAHLLTYAKGDGPWAQYDPRFADVRRAGWLGIADVLSDLDGRWAYPGIGYGAGIARLANDLLLFKPMPMLPGLVDIRDQLATNSGEPSPFGPSEMLPFSEKRGVVVHYSGPPVSNRDDTLRVIKSEAAYHVNRNWGSGWDPIYGDGLMYHVTIGDDGTKYLCRDLRSVLWHCAVTEWNRRALSVHVPIGGSQHATPAQLQSLEEVVNDWREITPTTKDEVWGHQELSATSCPGTLMSDFVYPYRNKGDQPMANGHFFGETGHYIGGGFWDYWNEHGGLMQFGYPLTDEQDELCEDGQVHTVQYFERAVFEYHPDNDPPFDILLRRLGAEVLEQSSGHKSRL